MPARVCHSAVTKILWREVEIPNCSLVIASSTHFHEAAGGNSFDHSPIWIRERTGLFNAKLSFSHTKNDVAQLVTRELDPAGAHQHFVGDAGYGAVLVSDGEILELRALEHVL